MSYPYVLLINFLFVIFYDMVSKHKQVVLLPNGMIGSICICSLRHNDNGVQNLSGLNGYLVSLLNPLYQNGNNSVYPALYGDGIFATLATIVHPYPAVQVKDTVVCVKRGNQVWLSPVHSSKKTHTHQPPHTTPLLPQFQYPLYLHTQELSLPLR